MFSSIAATFFRLHSVKKSMGDWRKDCLISIVVDDKNKIMKNRFKKVSLTNKILLLEILFIVVVSIFLFCGGYEQVVHEQMTTAQCDYLKGSTATDKIIGLTLVLAFISLLACLIRLDVKNEMCSEQIAEMKATIADMREEISKRQNIKAMEKER